MGPEGNNSIILEQNKCGVTSRLGEVVDTNAILQVVNPPPLVPPASWVGVHPQSLLLAPLPLPSVDATVGMHIPLWHDRAGIGKYQIRKKADCSTNR